MQGSHQIGEHREQASHGSPGGCRQIECFSQRYETDVEIMSLSRPSKFTPKPFTSVSVACFLEHREDQLDR
jgi:hypothetical protein